MDAELRDLQVRVKIYIYGTGQDDAGDGDVVRQRREQKDEEHQRVRALQGYPRALARAAALTVLSATVHQRAAATLRCSTGADSRPMRRRPTSVLVALSAAGLPTRPIAEGLEVTLRTAATAGDARLAATTPPLPRRCCHRRRRGRQRLQ